jgi:hypothetical protein
MPTAIRVLKATMARGRIGWPTWLRLRDCKWAALIDERPNPAPLRDGDRYRLHITAADRALYEHEWARYRELYPDVEAPEPAAHFVNGG